ncbi:MAG: pyrroline-5-carboxylate reductase [Clostridiales bacterium]|nr:pyrroline-5-carboxylate reductase [Clostridiales bacterium]
MKIGFIGCGNMASAIMGGLIKNEVFKPEEIIASDSYEESLKRAKEKFGVFVTGDNTECVKLAEVVVLSVKPQYYETVIEEIKDFISVDKLVITIAPGKTLSWLGERFGGRVKIVRTMPNTPALVGEGMTGVCKNEYVTEKDMDYALKILSSFGKAEVVSEAVMNAVVAVSGSSPAYVFMLIEAMADGAVAAGMSREAAYKFAAQAVLGSAKMVLETGKHPGELKDMVCSPAGTTIGAVKVLEEKGFRGAVMDAMEKCVEICRGM